MNLLLGYSTTWPGCLLACSVGSLGASMLPWAGATSAPFVGGSGPWVHVEANSGAWLKPK